MVGRIFKFKDDNFKTYKKYRDLVSFLHPNVAVERYDSNIRYEDKLRWFHAFNRKTTRLIFPSNLHECEPLDTIVWSTNVATSVGYTEHSILTSHNRCFNNLYAILDVPINWWRPLFDYRNGFFDKWNDVMTDLASFTEELIRNLDYVIFTSTGGEKFIILVSEFHFNFRKFNVVLTCFQGPRTKLSKIWAHFIPVFSIDGDDISSVLSVMKQVFLTQIKYAKVFAAVSNTSHPSYVENETLYLFDELINLRMELNISFDDTLFIVPPQHKPEVFFIDFKVKIIYDPCYFSPDDFETFLKFNNIEYEIEVKKDSRLMIERKKLGNFVDDVKLIPSSTAIESLFL